MELEQRVKLLEQEVEILKNQIQATLLDIQAQLLTNAYPSLRTEAGEEPARTVSNRSAVSPNAARVLALPQTSDEEDEPDPHDRSLVRKVSSTNARPQASNDDTMVSARPIKSARASRGLSQSPEPDDDDEPPQSDENPLVRRVSAANSRMQRSDDDTIFPDRPIRSARVSRAPSQPTEPGDGKEVDHADRAPSSHRPSKTQSPFDSEHVNIEAWIRNRVEQIGVERTWELIQVYEQKGRITPAVKATLLQFLSAYAQAIEQPQQPEVTAPGDTANRLILKLIAGVQNAGAGIGRRKKHNG